MKTCIKSILCLIGTLIMATHFGIVANESPGDRPTIESIRTVGSDIVVTVQAPAGVYKVVLESRTRLGKGAWIPRAVQWLDGEGGTLTFTLSAGSDLELLRVKAETVQILPNSFYEGASEFNGEAYAGTQSDAPTAAPPMAEFDSGNRAVDSTTGNGSRDVVESDIWAVRGETLYFFNQYRGLQIIDISNPAAPTLDATLELPAVGEQMYVLDESHVILLSRRACNYDGSTESAVLIVDVGGSTPQIVGEVELEGSIVESRLVGTALYVASQAYYEIINADERTHWTQGSIITSIDLAGPTTPILRDVERFDGYGNVIYATDQYLCVTVRNQWLDPSTLHLIDISNPNGNMTQLATLRTAGYVADKFKMNIDGDILTVISEARGRNFNDRSTLLENFSLAVPQKPDKLGEVQVGKGESLFATRFDGNKAYIVTFLQIDPLWIVDLSDPANPTVTGELEIPGWSTYIQPMGDQLVTIGIDNTDGWRVAVQLFDVSDPAAPSLLSKVPLGENHSWSEANSDEKALTVLPADGLILVPYQGFGENGYASQVQLIDIDLDAKELTPRGVIQHQLQPRRATLHEDTIFSISGRELLSVDASNRDEPVVLSNLALSWPVSQLELSGDYVIEVSADQYYGNVPQSQINIVSKADPNRIQHSVSLQSGWTLMGIHKEDSHLYVLESDYQANYWYGIPEEVGQQEGEIPPVPQLSLSVYDLSTLPRMERVGQTTLETETPPWGSNLNAHLVQPGVLVWTAGNGSFYYPFIDVGFSRGIVADFRYPYWNSGNNRLLAYDISNPNAPALLSDIEVNHDGNWWNFGKVFSENGLIFMSHQASEFVPLEEDELAEEEPNATVEPANLDDAGSDGSGDVKPEPVPEPKPQHGYWMQRYFLDVVDYSDPENPTPRPAVNIPGELIGISHQGEVLYTSGPHWDETFRTDYQPWLDASAYDGVSVSLITSMKLPDAWPKPVSVIQEQVILGRTNSDQTQASLEVWQLSSTGGFERLHAIDLQSPSYEFVVLEDLLLVQEQRGNEIFHLSLNGEMEWLDGGNLPGCLWFNLSEAKGSSSEGVWLPMNDYGVYHWSLDGE